MAVLHYQFETIHPFSDGNGRTGRILFMLDAIQATSVDTIARVREIRDLLDRTIDEIRTALPRIYTRELVETLFVHPYSKIEFLVNALGVERKAASRYLQSLEDLGLLASRKVGREKIYVNVRLMTILSRGTVA